MRRMMTKEVTSTLVKSAVMTVIDGVPTAQQLPEETLLGNVTAENAQKQLSKKHGQAVTVFEVQPDTIVYEMAVEDFIKIASVKVIEEQEELALEETPQA
jgi:hypothetical protein